MLRFNISVFFLFIVLLIFGCRQNKTTEELKAMFYDYEKELNIVVTKLQNDKQLDSLCRYSDKGLSDIKDLYPDFYSSLKRLGIKHVSSHKNVFNKYTNWYYFETTWPNEYLICLVFNAYDSSENKKDYYSKDEVANETWGLGNNWSMFRWVKDKVMKQ